ncbi:hypothetical protein NQZ68_041586 [Dissostichus eleginoides]|nr:hypothetical protein NQZ68_041586 [Dissostichus eleginoides]
MEGNPVWLIDPASVRPSIKRGPSGPVRNTLFRERINPAPSGGTGRTCRHCRYFGESGGFSLRSHEAHIKLSI